MSSPSVTEIEFLPLGAILQTLKVDGLNIVQGFPAQKDYETHNTPYFGATIGRVANRIADAHIASLNGGRSYTLAANNGPNSLHGGTRGWDKRIWDGPQPTGIRGIPGLSDLKGGETVEFTMRSADGEEGFPGDVDVKAAYTAGVQEVDKTNVTILSMEYEAELVGGAEETVINMTNHSYFNLSGDPTIEGTVVQLCTSHHLPVNDNGIPTGDPTPYPNLSIDTPFTLGAEEPDIDNTFVVEPAASPALIPLDTRSRPLNKLASAYHSDSGINLEVWSTEPAFQFYTGKYIDVPAVEGASARGSRSGFCIEPSRFVNAVNVERWRNQVLMKKGKKYGSRIVYRIWKE